MKDFQGKIAVVTGGGTGMGRELVRQLFADGCHVATCDVSAENMADTKALCEGPTGTRIATFVADVTDEAQLEAFRGFVAAEFDTKHINLLFNNAGIGGGGSFVADPRADWELTWNVCWGGVYSGCRVFLPMLLASDEGHVINTSSVNGFWAFIGPTVPHTAYSAAKFAVKGFTEALITDFRVNAPHLKASVVMPGHIGTSIVINSSKLHGRDPKELNEEQLVQVREQLSKMGLDVSGASDEDLRIGMQAQAEAFRDNAPMSAAEAATRILQGVRDEEWRILVGNDALSLDALVRENPVEAYEPSFLRKLQERSTMDFTRPRESINDSLL